MTLNRNSRCVLPPPKQLVTLIQHRNFCRHAFFHTFSITVGVTRSSSCPSVSPVASCQCYISRLYIIYIWNAKSEPQQRSNETQQCNRNWTSSKLKYHATMVIKVRETGRDDLMIAISVIKNYITKINYNYVYIVPVLTLTVLMGIRLFGVSDEQYSDSVYNDPSNAGRVITELVTATQQKPTKHT